LTKNKEVEGPMYFGDQATLLRNRGCNTHKKRGRKFTRVNFETSKEKPKPQKNPKNNLAFLLPAVVVPLSFGKKIESQKPWPPPQLLDFSLLAFPAATHTPPLTSVSFGFFP
jgi:hypothetical protein